MNLKNQILLAHSNQAKDFFELHTNDDPVKLMLKYAASPEKKWLASQLAIRKKLKRKLPEWTNNPSIIFPDGIPKEQASSEQTAKLKASLLIGHTMLDITGGMGVDSFYIGKNFKQCVMYERHTDLAAITQHNLQLLGAKNRIETKKFQPEMLSSKVDLIYADPARRDNANTKLVKLNDYEPNMVEWLPELLQKTQTVLIKTSPMLDIKDALQQLNTVSEVWVISVRNECKEVVFHCTNQPSPLCYKLFNVRAEGLDFEKFDESTLAIKPNLSFGLKTYLYEPNASIMKARAGDTLAVKIGLDKLHNNTNLFTSNELHLDFQGKVFEVKELLKPFDKTLRKQRFNVISRNYFQNAAEIAQKLKLKPASTDYLLAFTYLDERSKESQAFAKAHLLRF